MASSTPTLWDVFLSFRGIDTRYTFTDHLYHALHRNGIRTFKDEPGLRSGDVISDSLIHAIQESKTYIVILSENYASSSWCLDELVEILDCYKRMKRLVVPVFYNFEPAVVRHQIGSFKEAFEVHETRFEFEKVKRWRLTLKEVADFSGYHISINRSEADIIDEVVARILLEINPTTLDVAKYPVGLDSRIKGVTSLFNSDTEGVIRIGIHGMGGVGKTTLAKAVYNQIYHRFQGSSFLSNVREVSRTKGLAHLQQQLINDVLKRKDVNIDSVDQGIELIRARICSTKVLVVIDDLDDSKPLKYLDGSFALGSMIIITTRNEDLLDGMQVKEKYKVNQMDKEESRLLFNQHAFGDMLESNISDTFTELSKEILERAGGLPLALQVFGSTLFNESEEGWRWFIDRLKRASIDDIEENLMISFDALKSVDPNLQDIFLDIACFYVGWKREEVAKILETCYTFVNRKIDILKKRCLITIEDGDELGMHDLLQDMGSGIARNNCPDEPGKHSRLWDLDDIYSVLKKNKGTEVIRGIMANYSTWKDEVSFTAETFKRMSKLKFLYLEDVNITGSFEQTFEDLRWLCWKNCPLECLPSGFYPENLVKLELPRSEIRIMWELNMVSQVFGKLKTLKMSDSPNLTTTPDFTKLPCLETLDLKGCIRLEDVHVSIGCLVKLVYLDLGYCKNLRSLPDSISNLRALEVLTITCCSSLEALPRELGNIKSLKVLNALRLTVPKLPDSIGRLSNLVNLELSDCKNLAFLPDSICNLRSLKILDISNCEKLEELPEQLGKITSLCNLYVRDATMLRMLPDLSQLSNLEYLNLNDCCHLLSIEELPPNLIEIEAIDCRSLIRLPNLSNLKHLERMHLVRCWHLLSIPNLPPNLKWLRAYDCKYMEGLPNLSNLKQLEELILKNWVCLTDITGLEELTSLRNLDLNGCRKLLSIPELPPNLEKIRACKCTSVERIPDLSKLKQLKTLDLESCGLTEIQGLEELTSLQLLDISHCRSIKRLPNLSNLKQLERLDLTDCGDLLFIPELPLNLQWLSASDCRSMERLPILSDMKQLEELDLTDCSKLTEIIGLEKLTSLQSLRLTGCNSSILATLTKTFFQIFSGLGHKMMIGLEQREFPDWISKSRDLQSRMIFELPSNVCHSLLALVFCFKEQSAVVYHVENVTTESVWFDDVYSDTGSEKSWIVIVPRSILSIRDDCDNRFSVKSEEKVILGIHVLYETETRMIGENGSNVVNVEDVSSYPPKRPLRRKFKGKTEKKKVTASNCV